MNSSISTSSASLSISICPTSIPCPSKLHSKDSEKSSNDFFDDRPWICDLLKENSNSINSMKDLLKKEPLYQENTNRYDDIWLLRFLLSHNKNVNSAVKAASKTIKFRAAKKLNELGDIRHTLPTKDPALAKVMFKETTKMNDCVSDGGYYHTLPDDKRGIVTFMKVDKVNMKSMGSTIAEEDLLNAYIYLNESIYQILDHITRNTGRLTKQLKCIDFEGERLRQISMSFVRKDAAINKKLEDYYPQMLGMLVIVNAPTWFSKLFKTIRPLFPTRLLEKIDILPSLKAIQSKELEKVYRFISLRNLPERYGGSNSKWPLPHAGSAFR